MRGEFIRGDGLVVPNNVTLLGATRFLQAAFQAQHYGIWMGLCSGVYDPNLTLPDIGEPDFVNGYNRINYYADSGNWPTIGTVNNETFVESLASTFVATGAGFDKPISRMFLTDSSGSTNVLALSGALPAPMTILPSTPVEQRTFKYRFYLR